MATPANGKKLVHWDANSPDINNDSLSLSLSNESTESSFVSTSSLQYVNAQLVAHGFTSTPGLSLEGISNEDLNRVTKCFMDLLAQRMKDMARAEQLSTDIRTMNYDYERMKSMHQAASESSANFERELNTQRSRLATMTRTLQQAENTQKQTMLDLQRTRSALQTVRATHQAELKKKDKEVERMTEKWLKIADSQAKLGSTSSGLRFTSTPANAAVLGSGPFGKGKGYLETALDQAEKAREQLSLERTGLQMTVVRIANELQRIVHELKRYLPGNSRDVEDPPAFTLATLFPLAPTSFTNDTLTFLMNSLERSLCALELHYRDSLAVSSSTAKQPPHSVAVEDIEQLQEIIGQLRSELKESQEQTVTQASKVDEAFDGPVLNTRLAVRHTDTETNMELECLIALKRELEEERRALAEATLQLGKERAEIEAEKANMHEEKQTLHDDDEPMEVDPAPVCGSSSHSPAKRRRNMEDSPPSKKLKTKPARKSPLKSSFGKGLNGSRSSKRPSLSASYAVLTSPSKRPPKFEPAYETEVIPPSSLAPPSSLLPTSFALPPPSPNASFPAPQPTLLLSTPFEIPATLDHVQNRPDGQHTISTQPPPGTSAPMGDSLRVPGTPPCTRLFPIAKPLAPKMIHAYSPARPSPLSRILMLADSPDAITSGDMGLDTVPEEDMFPEIPLEDREAAAELPPDSSEERDHPMTLAQELGISESPPESPIGDDLRPASPPLQERRGDSNVSVAGKPTTAKGRVIHTSAAGMNTKATTTGGTSATVSSRRRPPPMNVRPTVRAAISAPKGEAGVKEKENKGKKGTTSSSQATSAVNPPRPRLKPSVPGVGVGRGAPRRVPVGSVDAPKSRKS